MIYKKQFKKLAALFSIVCIMSSCGQDTKSTSQEIKAESPTEKKVMSPIEKIRALNKETTALKSLQPIAIKDLENWLPESIKGMQKTNGGALTQDGIVGVNASYLEEHPEYGKDYGKNLKILIIDGYGEKGAMAAAAFVSIKYDNINAEKSNGYTKTVMYDDTTVKEEFDKSNKMYTLSFFYKNRFGVEMKLKGFEHNELWNAFKEFKLENLN